MDLAGHLRRSPKAIANGLGATDCRQPRSLEDPIVDGDDTGTLADIVGAGDVGYEQAEARATVAGLARIRSERDREVIRLHFEHGLLQSEIAERVGCSQMHVSRMLRYSIDAMALHARLAA